MADSQQEKSPGKSLVKRLGHFLMLLLGPLVIATLFAEPHGLFGARYRDSYGATGGWHHGVHDVGGAPCERGGPSRAHF